MIADDESSVPKQSLQLMKPITLHENTRAGIQRMVRMAAALCLLVLSLAAPWVTRAQVAGGSITGTVTAESGSVMPGVHVSITEVTSSAVRTVATDTDGFYRAPDLPP